MLKLLNIAAALAAVIFGMKAIAQDGSDTDIQQRMLIIYDSSNSMWGELEDKSRKYEAGKTALSELLKTDFGAREIGFRAYGHRRKADCRDSELMVPFAEAETATPKIKTAIDGVRPTGKTPITYSLQEGLKDFSGASGDILLISDGIETCDADPCDLMTEWQNSNVGIRVHVVGVGLTEFERAAMACIADASGGQYFDANSAEGFAEALTEASVAIEQEPEPEATATGEADPVEQSRGFALNIIARDEQGRSYIAAGKLFQNGEEIGDVTSNGRNVLEGPGNYEFEVGPVLADGSIYKPVRQGFSITEPGEVKVEVIVIRPAIVSAVFKEAGEEQRGVNVYAYKADERVFLIRVGDEALARPGEYEFRADYNDDNELSLTETLVESESKELVFDLTRTIQFYVEFVLPNGERFRRGSELWRDGEKVYSVFSGNPTTVVPGIYELRSGDQNLPIAGVEIKVEEDGETIEVPVDAGWVTISYAPSDFDYVSEPDRAFLESIERGKQSFARLETPIVVKPGAYRVLPHASRGEFDPIEIEVASNETVETELKPYPLGEIVVTYAASENWSSEPDRAHVTALEGQRIFKGYMTPGKSAKFLPGRYRVVGGGAAGKDAAPQEVVVTAGETTAVNLKHKED